VELTEFVDGALDVAENMDRAGELTFSGGHFYYPAYDPPALKVNIRGAGQDSVTLRVGQEEIGSMEYERALSQAHTGAIYLHRGEPFEVLSLNLETKNAELTRFTGNYYSQARVQSMLEPQTAIKSKLVYYLAGCRVTDLVVAYAKKSFDGDTVLDVVNLDLPEVSFDTVCLRIDLPPLDLDDTLDRQIGGIHGVEHAILALAPLFAGCDRGDIGSAWFTHFVDTGNPAVFLFDRTPGGVGIAELLYDRVEDLVQAAYYQVKNCPCESGCPSCLLLAGCEVGNEQLDKSEAMSYLAKLI
jgi:DEAD/DEAH box helicase domain-containing protein